MVTTKVDVDALAIRFLECTPPLDPDGRKISIALYRLLAEGKPVVSRELATKVGLHEERVQEILRSWQGVFYNERGRIHGYCGLAIPEMKHRFEVAGKALYTWCAWDALFLPEILQKTAQVTSSCPVTGARIRLRVDPDRIEIVEPAEMVMSFPSADGIECGDDVITNFCRFVHFLGSREAASRWLEEHPAHLILSSDEALKLARKKNALQYGVLE